MRSKKWLNILAYILSFIVAFLILLVCFGNAYDLLVRNSNRVNTQKEKEIANRIYEILQLNPNYEEDLIQELGKDDYGNEQFLYCIPSKTYSNWQYIYAKIPYNKSTGALLLKDIKIILVESEAMINPMKLFRMQK